VRTLLLSVLVVMVTVSASQLAHAERWSPGSWRPFSNKRQSVQKKPLLGGVPLVRSLQGGSDRGTIVGKVGNGTKRVVGTATDVLTLRRWRSDDKSNKTSTPWQQSTTRGKKADSSDGSFFRTLFWRENEPEPPRTPQEFMALDRPNMFGSGSGSK